MKGGTFISLKRKPKNSARVNFLGRVEKDLKFGEVC